MTTSRVVALCLCLLLAPVAQAQTSGLVNTIIHGCTSGWTSGLCHAALNRASGLCKGQGNKGNCAQLFSELCQVNQHGYLYEEECLVTMSLQQHRGLCKVSHTDFRKQVLSNRPKVPYGSALANLQSCRWRSNSTDAVFTT